MAPINYDKWNHVEGLSSDEDEAAAAASAATSVTSPGAHSMFLPPKALTKGRPKARLISVPWDPYCEAVRWALDSHGTEYVDEILPWGLHAWVTLGFSDPLPQPQQLNVPVFVNEKNEVYKRSPTDIYMSLFAQSFHTRNRLFSSSASLDLLELVDSELGPAARTIYLHTITSSPVLAERCLLARPPYSDMYAILERAAWPVLLRLLRSTYDISPAAVDRAWAKVDEVFRSLDDALRTNGRDRSSPASPSTAAASPSATAASSTTPTRFLAGSLAPTACDFAFASHAALLLLPFDHSPAASAAAAGARPRRPLPPRNTFLRCLPALADLPADVRARIETLRASRPGRLALSLWHTHRPPSLARPAPTPRPPPALWRRLLAASREPRPSASLLLPDWPGWATSAPHVDADPVLRRRARVAAVISAAAVASAVVLLVIVMLVLHTIVINPAFALATGSPLSSSLPVPYTPVAGIVLCVFAPLIPPSLPAFLRTFVKRARQLMAAATATSAPSVKAPPFVASLLGNHTRAVEKPGSPTRAFRSTSVKAPVSKASRTGPSAHDASAAAAGGRGLRHASVTPLQAGGSTVGPGHHERLPSVSPIRGSEPADAARVRQKSASPDPGKPLVA